MILYTRGKPGKLSIVISDATPDQVSLARAALSSIESTKFFVYEEKKVL